MTNLIQVPPIRTTYTKQQLVDAICSAWFKLYGSYPSNRCVGLLYAQTAIETGLTTSMWNNNFGNIKVPSNPPPDTEYMMLDNVFEFISGKKVYFQPPHRQTWFLSFPTLSDGIAHHLTFLKNNRYKSAWSAIESGDIASFASILKSKGYYTAALSDYLAGLKLYLNLFLTSKMYDTAMTNLQQQNTEEPILDLDDLDFDFQTIEFKLKNNTYKLNVSKDYYNINNKYPRITYPQAVAIAANQQSTITTVEIEKQIHKIAKRIPFYAKGAPYDKSMDEQPAYDTIDNKINTYKQTNKITNVLVSGHKKIIAFDLSALAKNKIMIYGANGLSDAPLQSPNTSHHLNYTDYSQSVRLVKNECYLNNQPIHYLEIIKIMEKDK